MLVVDEKQNNQVDITAPIRDHLNEGTDLIWFSAHQTLSHISFVSA